MDCGLILTRCRRGSGGGHGDNMKLDGTKDKLEEVKFFLGHLEETQNKAQSPTQTPFRYYLSAFLGAAYSVEQCLQTEVVAALRDQARTQRKALSGQDARRLYGKRFAEWRAALPHPKLSLWDSMMDYRGGETHRAERTKTATQDKAVPIDYARLAERGFAFAAYYVMQQQAAFYYPEVAERAAKEGLPFQTGAWTYIKEHHLEIGGVRIKTVKACEECVALLEGLVKYFEPLLP